MMSKATHTYTTHDSASPPTPSIYELGVWLAAAQQNLDRLQEAKDGFADHKAKDTFSTLEQRSST